MKVIAIIMLASASVFGHELEFNNYLKLQSALATDNFESALDAHQTICAKELGHYTENYTDCGKKFKNIGELRQSFKGLSSLFIGNGKSKELEKLQVVKCPMAKAKWVQQNGDIQNPYYGKKMLSCGEKI